MGGLENWTVFMDVICVSSLSKTVRKILKGTCKSNDNKYMIASIQIRNTETFAFIAALVLKLLSPKALLTNRKENRNC